MPWNTTDHRRKFLKAEGEYLAEGQVRAGEFAFWGEWEPPSDVIQTYPENRGELPHYLHDPFWHLPTARTWRQNTDPLVFGDRFLYTNCRQQQNKELLELSDGSVILFGSQKGRGVDARFVLDAVFVIAGHDDFSLDSSSHLAGADWVQAVVFEPLRLGGGPPADTYRAYRSRTYGEAPDGPFSFVPCRPIGAGEVPFTRPTIRLDDKWITPTLAMNARPTQASEREIRLLWEEVVHQVVDIAGLNLGVRLEVPDRREPVLVREAES